MSETSTPTSATSIGIDEKLKCDKINKQSQSGKTKDALNTSANETEAKDKQLSKRKETEKITILPAIITDEETGELMIPEASNGANMYQYRDFSNVPESELENQPMTAPPPPPSSRGPMEQSIRVQKFPVKLYTILAQKEFQEIVCWMPHGRSWKVLKANLFESLVMPLFFEYSNYHSFNRLVNAWSFRRISTGPDRGSYYHELFLRGKPYLQKYMRRLPKTHKKLPMKKEDEPDFYSMDKANPLPAVEESALSQGITSDPQIRPVGMSTMRGGVASAAGLSNPGMMGSGMGVTSGGMGYDDPFLTRHQGMMSSGMMGSGMSNMMSGGMSGMMPGGMGGMMSGGMGGMSNMMSGGMGGIMHGGMGRMSNMMSGGMGMPGMMGGMSGMEGMGGMMPGSMSGMNSMGGIGTGLSPMSGALRESQYGGPGAVGSAAGDMEFQRLRHIQQMHMLDRQNSSLGNLGGDPMDRMRSWRYEGSI